jgi:hypothetical protein
MAPVVSLGQILQFSLFLKQGADITITLTVVDAAGAPITNPSGWTAKAQIRSTPWSSVLFEWNTAGGPGIGSVVLAYDSVEQVSTLTLVITRAQSSLFVWTSALWDCFLTNPSGLDACVAEGNVSVTPAITQ